MVSLTHDHIFITWMMNKRLNCRAFVLWCSNCVRQNPLKVSLLNISLLPKSILIEFPSFTLPLVCLVVKPNHTFQSSNIMWGRNHLFIYLSSFHWYNCSVVQHLQIQRRLSNMSLFWFMWGMKLIWLWDLLMIAVHFFINISSYIYYRW